MYFSVSEYATDCKTNFWYLISIFFVFDQERKGLKMFSVLKKLCHVVHWSIPRRSSSHQNLPPWAGDSMWIGAWAWQHLHFLAHQDGYWLINGHCRYTKRNSQSPAVPSSKRYGGGQSRSEIIKSIKDEGRVKVFKLLWLVWTWNRVNLCCWPLLQTWQNNPRRGPLTMYSIHNREHGYSIFLWYLNW